MLRMFLCGLIKILIRLIFATTGMFKLILLFIHTYTKTMGRLSIDSCTDLDLTYCTISAESSNEEDRPEEYKFPEGSCCKTFSSFFFFLSSNTHCYFLYQDIVLQQIQSFLLCVGMEQLPCMYPKSWWLDWIHALVHA
jgi:hypothetical protein